MNFLEKMSVDHPYYCSDSNYFSNEPNQEYKNMTEFLSEWKDCDVELNLIFRWDIKPYDEEISKETKRYYAEVFMILQRKGIFKPIRIEDVNEEEAKLFYEFIKPHFNKLLEMWKPMNIHDKESL